jgi:hypothetical protein
LHRPRQVLAARHAEGTLRRLVMPLTLVLALVGTQGGDDRPTRFEYFRGNEMFGGESVRWVDGRLIWMWLGHNGEGGRDTREEEVPPADAWRAFWWRLDSISVWSWKTSYPAMSSAPDLDSWRVVITHGTRSVHSSSYAVAPPRADEFHEALTDLFEAARRQGHEWEPERLTLSVWEQGKPWFYYWWRPTVTAVSYVNLEPRRDSGPTHTDPAQPRVATVPGTLTVQITDGAAGSPKRERHVPPARTAWLRFWSRLDRDGVWQAPPTASRAITPPQENHWSLEIRHGPQRVMADGTGALPPVVRAVRASIDQLIAAYLSPSRSALASKYPGASWIGSKRPPLSPIAR